MQLLTDEARCSGCRACELTCVARHDGHFATTTARIRVRKTETRGVDSPRVCRQCADAPCVTACPAGALVRHPSNGAIHLRRDDCLVCSACFDACPFEAVFPDPVSGMPLVCDLCDGEPACVKRCATGALSEAGRV